MKLWGIFDLKVKSQFGPWSDQTRFHPGVVVSRPSGPPTESWYIVMPMTSSEPRGLSTARWVRASTIPGIDGVMYVCCDLPTVVGHSELAGARLRGTMPADVRQQIEDRIIALFELRPSRVG